MNKNELLSLQEGQFVIYCGETDKASGISKGDIFELKEIGAIGFRMYRLGSNYTVTEQGRTDSRCTKYYKVIPNLNDNENDETELESKDYEVLIDYALEIKDFNWCRELHAAGQKNVF